MSVLEQQLFSGALSGLAATVCLQPFDVLKTRVQQRDGRLKLGNAGIIMRTVRDILALRGLSGMWRGTTASLVRNIPGVALYMTTLAQLRAVLSTSPYFVNTDSPSQLGVGNSSSVLPALTSQGNLVAGATARVAVGFFLNPFSVLKVRYESNLHAYESFSTAFVTIIRLGPSELLRGFMTSSLRDAPYAGLFVAIYESAKRETSLVFPPTTKARAIATHALSAAFAGAVATMATHPFDVIKTKIQVRSEDRYRSLRSTVRTVWDQRGISGFFDGASLRMSRKVLSSAIGWAVYEGTLMLIKTNREVKH